MIVARRAVGEGHKAPQQIEFLVPEPGDVRDAPGARQRRKMRQQKDLLEPTGYLPGLPATRHIAEIMQERGRLMQNRRKRPIRVHRMLRSSEQRMCTDPGLQHFGTLSFTRLS